LANVPWYDNATIPTSSCYLTLATVGTYGMFFDRANECVSYSTPTYSAALTALANGTSIYILD